MSILKKIACYCVPTQACCIEWSGNCYDLTVAECLALSGGTPMGPGTTCANTVCGPPVACDNCEGCATAYAWSITGLYFTATTNYPGGGSCSCEVHVNCSGIVTGSVPCVWQGVPDQISVVHDPDCINFYWGESGSGQPLPANILCEDANGQPPAFYRFILPLGGYCNLLYPGGMLNFLYRKPKTTTSSCPIGQYTLYGQATGWSEIDIHNPGVLEVI